MIPHYIPTTEEDLHETCDCLCDPQLVKGEDGEDAYEHHPFGLPTNDYVVVETV